MAYQNERLVSFLKKEVGMFLSRDFPHDPDVFLSVANVVINSSSDEAKIYVSVFPESSGDDVLKKLKFHCAEARKCVAKKLHRRKIPKIFFLPASTEEIVRLEKLLEKVKNEENPAP